MSAREYSKLKARWDDFCSTLKRLNTCIGNDQWNDRHQPLVQDFYYCGSALFQDVINLRLQGITGHKMVCWACETLNWKLFVSVASQLTWTVVGISGSVAWHSGFLQRWVNTEWRTVYWTFSQRLVRTDTFWYKSDRVLLKWHWSTASTASSQPKAHNITPLQHTQCQSYWNNSLKFLHLFDAVSDGKKKAVTEQ